ALCYYYMGSFGDAMETVEEVLKDDPFNVHALCNLAVFYYHLNHPDLKEMVEVLRKLAPFRMEQTYKLATTLGILEDHKGAYLLFKKLIAHSGYGDIHMLHYGAVAAYNSGLLTEAEALWKRVKRLDPTGVVAPYYLEQIERKEAGKPCAKGVSYHYQLMEDEKVFTIEEWKEELVKDPLIRSSFLWALRYGDRDTKIQVIRAFEVIPDKEFEEALRLLLLNPAEDDELKQQVIDVLKNMGAEGPFASIFQHREQMLGFDDAEKWQKVLHCLKNKMQNRYDHQVIEEARLFWLEFIDKAYPGIPNIRKVEAWAASVEYLLLKRSKLSVTREAVSKLYGISITTLDRNCKVIRETFEKEL
ncbi:MAG TPA: DDE transposase family protein, partial [Paenibacillaceae bacterium]|nr:DDE transposase family protein [Paenibacillaceae bacterium]